jgi:ketosteroid isomerase-like protein
MASPRIEWAERIVVLWNSGDIERWLDEIGPDFEFTPDPSFPDWGVYSGEELREWMREWTRTWKDNRFEMLGFDEQGDVGLIRSRWHLAAPESGGEVPVADFTLVVWWDGPDAPKPHRMESFFDHEQAMRAARGGTG